MHDLERHVAAERLAHRLVDHAHSALAQIAEDPVVAQPFGDLWLAEEFGPAKEIA